MATTPAHGTASRLSPCAMRALAVAVLALLALPADAQRFDTLVKNVAAPIYAGAGRLVPEVTIGGTDQTADEYLFVSIGYLLAAMDGTLWVIDGRPARSYTLRQYDQSGRFIRNVGRRGHGPGEWQAPDMFAQLRDGRVIVRDAVVGRPLTFYKPNGDYDTGVVRDADGVEAIRRYRIAWTSPDTRPQLK